MISELNYEFVQMPKFNLFEWFKSIISFDIWKSWYVCLLKCVLNLMAECIARCRIWNYISYNWNYSTQVSNKDNNVQTKGLSLKTRAQNIDILIRRARSKHTRHPHYGNGWNKSNLMPLACKAHCKKGSKSRLTQSAC